MLGTASAFLSCLKAEAQGWVNEGAAAAAAATHNANGGLLSACSIQVPGALQSASPSIVFESHDNHPSWCHPHLVAEKNGGSERLGRLPKITQQVCGITRPETLEGNIQAGIWNLGRDRPQRWAGLGGAFSIACCMAWPKYLW